MADDLTVPRHDIGAIPIEECLENLREWHRRRRPGNGGRGWSRRCKPISHVRDKVVGLVVRGILKICPRDAEPRPDDREEPVVEIETEGTAQMIPDPSDPLIGKLPAVAV